MCIQIFLYMISSKIKNETSQCSIPCGSWSSWTENHCEADKGLLVANNLRCTATASKIERHVTVLTKFWTSRTYLSKILFLVCPYLTQYARPQWPIILNCVYSILSRKLCVPLHKNCPCSEVPTSALLASGGQCSHNRSKAVGEHLMFSTRFETRHNQPHHS